MIPWNNLRLIRGYLKRFLYNNKRAARLKIAYAAFMVVVINKGELENVNSSGSQHLECLKDLQELKTRQSALLTEYGSRFAGHLV